MWQLTFLKAMKRFIRQKIAQLFFARDRRERATPRRQPRKPLITSAPCALVTRMQSAAEHA
jgi:hypothetical protein